MTRRLAGLVLLALALAGCHDYASAYDECVGRGGCEPPGGSTGALTLSPSAPDFGTIPMKAKGPPATLTLTNAGSASSGTLTAAVGGAAGTAYLLSADGCTGQDVAPGATCTVQVSFAPQKEGDAPATLTISSAHGSSAAATLHGTGGPLSTITLAPATAAFGNALVHAASMPKRLTVTNGGTSATSSLALSVYGADAVDFSLAADGCSGTTLGPAAQCTVDVVLTPPSPGGKAATLQVLAAQGGLAAASLSGTGLAPGDLSTTPSTFDFGLASKSSPSAARSFHVANAGATATGSLAVSVTGTDGSDFLVQSGDTCSGQPLAAGAGCDVSVVFQPAGGGAKSATLSVSGTPGGATTAALSGTGLAPASLVTSPSPVAFGGVAQGVAVPVAVTLTNPGGVSTGTVSLALGSGAAAKGYALTSTVTPDGCSGKTLAGGASCSFEVTFTPSAVGAAASSLVVLAAGLTPLTVPVTGTGLAPGALLLSGNLAFGAVDVGVPGAPRTLVVSNSGGVTTGAIAITTAGPNAADLTLSSDQCTGKTLAPSATCSLAVGFAPPLAGPRSATLTVTATPGGADTVSLTGSGRATVSVTLTGSGQGRVFTADGGLDCPFGACAVAIQVPSVTLTATPTPPSTFGGFSGCDSTPSPTQCTVGLDGGRAVGANFVGACNGGPCTLVVNLAGRDGGSGVLRWGDGGVACAQPSCTFKLDAGVHVNWAATPNGSDAFEAWTGVGPCGIPPGCAFDVSADSTQTAVFTRVNRLFVTSQRYAPSSLGGLAGADARCAAAARDAGLPGTYKALLADSTTSDVAHIGSARGWVRPDGLPVFDQLNAFTTALYPARLTERGQDVLDGGFFQLAYSDDPTAASVLTSSLLGTAASFCGDWTSSGGTVPTVGSASGGYGTWYNGFFAGAGSCTTPVRLYCLGVDYQAQLPPPAAKGRYAFATLNPFMPGGGIASADALCAAEAADAGLPGAYLALLGDSAAPSTTWSRFDGGGPQWVRPDGVIFTREPDKFVHLKALPLAPLAVTARGDSPFGAGYSSWIGRDSSGNTTAATSCNGWQTASNLATGAEATPYESSAEGLYLNGYACSQGLRIYCLQQ